MRQIAHTQKSLKPQAAGWVCAMITGNHPYLQTVKDFEEGG